MKEQSRHKLRIFEIVILNTKWEDCQSRKNENVYEKFYVLEIAAVNLSRLLFPEKRKENMQTKQPQFKSRWSKPFS